MKKNSKFILIGIYLTLLGCGNNNQLTLEQCTKGYFCYKNINFGKSRGELYEKGIKDGCKTGEGTFTKDYSLSSTSKDYFDGWILGRSKCKQILPNEGTMQAEINSRKRAEYQIRKLKMEQLAKDSDSEEGIVDALLNGSNDNISNDEVEY